jgi:hypothetical protein
MLLIKDFTVFLKAKDKVAREFFWEFVEKSHRALFSILGFSLIALSASIVETSISPLVCSQIVGGGYRMVFNPGEVCFTDQWWIGAQGAITFLAFYLIIIPCGLMWNFYVHRKEIDSPKFLVTFGIFVFPYRIKCYFWELMNLLRRILFIVFSQFKFLKPYFFLVVLFFFVLELYVSPFKNSSMNLLNNT